MTPAMLRAAESVDGVKCHDLTCGQVIGSVFTKSRGGWQSKTKALLASEAVECLWLDADCFPLADPTFLFDCPEFTSTGAMFWPDSFSWEKKHLRLANIFGVNKSCITGPQFESGALMVDKSRGMQALKLADTYNRNSERYYKVIFGDKDTFFFAWNKTETAYHLIQTPVKSAKGAFVQHGPNGKALFHHAIQAKFTPTGRSRLHPNEFPYHTLCPEWAREFWEIQQDDA